MAVKEITVREIGVTIDTDVFDDFANLRLLAKAQKGDLVAVAGFAENVLGEEQLEDVMGRLAVDGTCHVEDMATFVFECLDAAAQAVQAGDGKN